MVSFSRVRSAVFHVFVPATISLAFLSGCADASRGDIVIEVIEVTDVGFVDPRAVLHDPVADVYLVSNVNGNPLARDENGFVSRLSPDGDVLDLAWIRTLGPTERLHAPKGMAILGDSLFIADVACVRVIHRETGAWLTQTCLDNVTALSGLDVGPEGSLFVTDQGLDLVGDALEPTGTGAVYRMVMGEERLGSTLATGSELGLPAGIAVGTRGIFVVTSDPGQILRLTATGDRTTILSRPGASFDGVVFVRDGFAYSSVSDAAIYLVDGQGTIHTVMEGVDSPGDLGYDISRNRLLVPLSDQNRVIFIDLE